MARDPYTSANGLPRHQHQVYTCAVMTAKKSTLSQPTRRKFLASSAALAFPAIVPSSVLGKDAPSNKMTIGFIGTGNNGTGWIKRFLKDERVRIVSVCDVNRESSGYWLGSVRGREPARLLVDEHYGGTGCAAYEDFRDVLASKDLDAVYIGTPDHWHAYIAIAAARAGKHIYCQKPLALTVAEGRRIVTEVERAGIVWQTGSQQRSSPEYRRVCELVRNGRIGKLHTVRCVLPGGTPDYGKTAHLTEPAPVPDGFNFDMWLGPAPEAAYAAARVGVNFRWNYDYSGGQVTDWGAHEFDIAQWAMDMDHSGPVAIKRPKAKFSDHPVYDTASEFSFECRYQSGVRVIVNYEPMRGREFPECQGVTFGGDDGWLGVTRGFHWASSQEIHNSEIGENEIRLYHSENHVTNFVDCVFSGEKTIVSAETGHRSVTVAHLGNIALRTGRELRWDPAKEEILDDPGASAMLSREYRKPWVL